MLLTVWLRVTDKNSLCSDNNLSPIISNSQCVEAKRVLENDHGMSFGEDNLVNIDRFAHKSSHHTYPKGCFIKTSSTGIMDVSFNSHHTGSRRSNSMQICKYSSK